VLGTLALLATFALLGFQWWIEEPRMAAQTASWTGRDIENGAALYSANCASCHGVEGQGGVGVAPALQSRYFFTNRISDIGFSGTLHDYVAGTVAAGRPSKPLGQWAQHMPVWSSRYGGPMRDDQVLAVTAFVLNWERDALQQTPEEDPWIPFEDGSKMTAVTGEVIVTEPAGGATDGPRDPELLFVSMGCQGCHNLEQDQSADNPGPVAPHLGNIDTLGSTYEAGKDAVTYVHDSIVNPNAFVHPGYAAGIMPQNFTERMSEEEITALAAWIVEQAAAN
jgi:mono/diheme cytochrome c family protein